MVLFLGMFGRRIVKILLQSLEVGVVVYVFIGLLASTGKRMVKVITSAIMTAG